MLKRGGGVCTVTDSEWMIRNRQPLATYFPETVQVELRRDPRLAWLRALMEDAGFVDITETMQELPHELSDLRPYRDRAFSILHLIPGEAYERGMQRMERDLGDGPLACTSRYALLCGRK